MDIKPFQFGCQNIFNDQYSDPVLVRMLLTVEFVENHLQQIQ